jgi:hypothetical protein
MTEPEGVSLQFAECRMLSRWKYCCWQGCCLQFDTALRLLSATDEVTQEWHQQSVTSGHYTGTHNAEQHGLLTRVN